jgi:delta8-fatty-acid desaturase
MAHSSIVTGLPPTAGNAPERTPKLMSRNDVEALIAEGKHITIFHNQVIKMDAWMPYHPGGDKAMLHLVGKDASDEIDA